MFWKKPPAPAPHAPHLKGRPVPEWMTADLPIFTTPAHYWASLWLPDGTILNGHRPVADNWEGKQARKRWDAARRAFPSFMQPIPYSDDGAALAWRWVCCVAIEARMHSAERVRDDADRIIWPEATADGFPIIATGTEGDTPSLKIVGNVRRIMDRHAARSAKGALPPNRLYNDQKAVLYPSPLWPGARAWLALGDWREGVESRASVAAQEAGALSSGGLADLI